MRKKSQMEIIGLVIIVILIALGMLFMAQFALKGDPKKKIFVRKGLAYSTMGALMKTDILCKDYGLSSKIDTKYLAIGEKLVDDCAGSFADTSRSTFMCDNQHSCVFLGETVADLLNQTLGKWNKHYEFKSNLVYGTKVILLVNVTDSSGKGCPGERDTSGLFPFNTPSGIVENVLYVCD